MINLTRYHIYCPLKRGWDFLNIQLIKEAPLSTCIIYNQSCTPAPTHQVIFKKIINFSKVSYFMGLDVMSLVDRPKSLTS